MTKDELLKLAIDAGVVPVNRAHQHLEPVWWSVTAEDLGKFAGIVAAAEREACAKLCETTGEFMAQRYGDGAECITTGEECAENIRARSNVEGKGRCATLYRAASSGGRRPERP